MDAQKSYRIAHLCLPARLMCRLGRVRHLHWWHLLLVPVMALLACATAYGPRGVRGGYSESQLGENIFTVNFAGNGFINVERTVDFCMLRCAELTLLHGFRYFVVVQAAQGVNQSYYTAPSTAIENGGVSTAYPGITTPIIKPGASNTIVCFKDKPKGGIFYDAKFVEQSMRKKYNLKARRR